LARPRYDLEDRPAGDGLGSPTEVFELARRDWHGIGWAAIELIYGDDDTLRGLAHVPATEVRVRRATPRTA